MQLTEAALQAHADAEAKRIIGDAKAAAKFAEEAKAQFTRTFGDFHVHLIPADSGSARLEVDGVIIHARRSHGCSASIDFMLIKICPVCHTETESWFLDNLDQLGRGIKQVKPYMHTCRRP